MAFGVASNYAATFRPVGVAPGFSQVKSDLATDYLSRVPILRQQLEMNLAKQALAEAGATKRLDMQLDARKEVADKTDRANKLLAIANMSGGDGGSSSLLSPLEQQLAFENLQGNLEVVDDARKVLASQRISQRMGQVDDDVFKVLGQNLNTSLNLESFLPKADADAVKNDAELSESILKAMRNTLDQYSNNK